MTPSLAEPWSASPDGLVYESVLRKRARPHNGEPVTAVYDPVFVPVTRRHALRGDAVDDSDHDPGARAPGLAGLPRRSGQGGHHVAWTAPPPTGPHATRIPACLTVGFYPT